MQRVRRRLTGAAVAVAVGLGLAAAGLLPGALAGAAGEFPTIMVVVDGSGSMAGPLEPRGQLAKHQLVRDALRTALVGVAPQVRVGLAAFGHRRGNCNDAEILATPEPVDVERLMTPLAQLRPRGKGPLTYAIRETAKLLPGETATPRSLLLIHDGIDNCQQDVCTAAAELAAAKIATHVVSLGVPAEDLGKMACLPQVTGGRHFKVDTAEQLAGVLGEVLHTAARGMPAFGLGPAAPPGAQGAAIVPPPPIPASGPVALHLRALTAPNTEPLNVALHWVVSREDDPNTVVFDAWAVNPAIPVTPGRHVVTVRSELVSASEAVLVRENRPMAVPVSLGAGALRVRVMAQKTNASLTDAIVTLSGADGTPLAVFKGGEAGLLLPPGQFRVAAELGYVRVERNVTVTAGRPAAVDIALNVGRLELTTAARDGVSPLEAALFIVMEDDPPRDRREVARSAARQAEFALPPGTYYVVARQGSVEARERLDLGSGDVIRRTLTAPAGRLGLSTTHPGTSAPTGVPVSYSIRRLDDPSQDIVTTSKPAPVMFLPAGRYQVEARYGEANVATTLDVELKAGQNLELPVEHLAATLNLRVSGARIGAAREVTWEVRDEAGRVVWFGSQAEAATVVQTGRYVVTARAPGVQEERTVELRAGDSKLVEIRVE